MSARIHAFLALVMVALLSTSASALSPKQTSVKNAKKLEAKLQNLSPSVKPSLLSRLWNFRTRRDLKTIQKELGAEDYDQSSTKAIHAPAMAHAIKFGSVPVNMTREGTLSWKGSDLSQAGLGRKDKKAFSDEVHKVATLIRRGKGLNFVRTSTVQNNKQVSYMVHMSKP
jgi:hypothetical protein